MWWLICVENGPSSLVRAETAEAAGEWWNNENNPYGIETYNHPYIYKIQKFSGSPDDFPGDFERVDLINPE